MPIQTVAQPSPLAGASVLANRHRLYVADTTQFQVADPGMVDSVRAFPHIVRRKRDHADDPTDPIVERAPAEECSVAAVVLDHE